MSLEGALANVGKKYSPGWSATIRWRASGEVDGHDVHVELVIAIWPWSHALPVSVLVFVRNGGLGLDAKDFYDVEPIAASFKAGLAYYNMLIERYCLMKCETEVFFNDSYHTPHGKIRIYAPSDPKENKEK